MNDELQAKLDKCENLPVYESFIVSKTNFERYEKPVVSVSDGVQYRQSSIFEMEEGI